MTTRRRDFEDALGSGKRVKVPDRPYTRLADDPRLNPQLNFSLDQAKELEARAILRRRFWEDVHSAASSAGIHIHEAAIQAGAHKRPARTGVTDDVEARVEAAIARREADAVQRDDRVRANLERAASEVEAALSYSPHMVDRIAAAARGTAGRAGGLAGGFLGGGIGHDAGDFLAGNAAKGAVYAADAVGQTSAGVVAGTGKAALMFGAKALGFGVVDDRGREL